MAARRRPARRRSMRPAPWRAARGDRARARSLSEESLALYRELGNARGAACGAARPGPDRIVLGNYARVSALVEESLALGGGANDAGARPRRRRCWATRRSSRATTPGPRPSARRACAGASWATRRASPAPQQARERGAVPGRCGRGNRALRGEPGALPRPGQRAGDRRRTQLPGAGRRSSGRLRPGGRARRGGSGAGSGWARRRSSPARRPASGSRLFPRRPRGGNDALP